jgi:hypothetical protein
MESILRVNTFAIDDAATGERRLDRIGDMLHLSRDRKTSGQQICDAAQKEAAPCVSKLTPDA